MIFGRIILRLRTMRKIEKQFRKEVALGAVVEVTLKEARGIR